MTCVFWTYLISFLAVHVTLCPCDFTIIRPGVRHVTTHVLYWFVQVAVTGLHLFLSYWTTSVTLDDSSLPPHWAYVAGPYYTTWQYSRDIFKSCCWVACSPRLDFFCCITVHGWISEPIPSQNPLFTWTHSKAFSIQVLSDIEVVYFSSETI